MEYQDYSNWKGWLNQIPFGDLSVLQKKQYALQLERLRIPYKNINALEIGYGNGSFLTFMMNNGSKVEGIEIQEPLLNAARAIGIPALNSIDSARNGPYDLIAAFDVLEHLTIDQLKTLFQKCRTLLKENGAMIFRFPNADSFAGLGSQNGDYTHITAIGQTKLQQLIEPYGFKIERFESEIVYPKNVVVHAIRSCFRYLLMKGMGIGSPYYFSGNVVALVTHKDATNK